MVLSLCASLCRKLSKSRKYSECGATASPRNQRRKPSVSAKPSAFRLLLLEISKHLGEKDVQNFKASLEYYVQENDKGAATVDQLQEVTTAFCLLMASAKVGFIQPDHLSNLTGFLDVSGHSVLVQEIEDFQRKEQSECSINNRGISIIFACSDLRVPVKQIFISYFAYRLPYSNSPIF